MDPQSQPAPIQPNASDPIESVTASTWKSIGTRYLAYVILYVCAFAAVVYFIPSPFSIIVMVMIGLVGYSVVNRKIKREFMQEFGASVGFAYSKNAGLETVSGKLFKTGHSQSIFDVLSGSYQNMPMRVFTFSFTIGYGKNSHTYSYTVFESALAGTVPDILLYSNAHGSEVSDWFSGDETIELEGDFNKYLRLRVPKGYEQEAYQIFTPDVMADLIDKARQASFEFTGNRLYIYATKVITKREELQSMFELSEYLTGLFRKNTANMNDASLPKAQN